MLPFYIDIDPNQDVSTTLNKEKTELVVQAIPTSFDEDLVKLNDFITEDLTTVYTTVSFSNQILLEYQDFSTLMSDDFDVISKFRVKKSHKIKAKIKKSSFNPSSIVD
jgi:hypothetical protein